MESAKTERSIFLPRAGYCFVLRNRKSTCAAYSVNSPGLEDPNQVVWACKYSRQN
jgi:hypothetical protein